MVKLPRQHFHASQNLSAYSCQSLRPQVRGDSFLILKKNSRVWHSFFLFVKVTKFYFPFMKMLINNMQNLYLKKGKRKYFFQ